jgi:hypothetical protein
MRLLGELPRHRHMVSGFAFTPDGRYVVSSNHAILPRPE